MASVIEGRGQTANAGNAVSLAPALFDKLLAAGAALLAVAVMIAVAKGVSQGALVPASVWWHVGTIYIALLLTPVMMLRRRGDRLHRTLGYVWVVAMFATAAISFDIRGINRGEFSLIHILSAYTLLQAPLIVWRARQHNHAVHRRSVRLMALGALLIAGFFTFPFNRLMGMWLFS